jgi:23S rRNA (adenine2503-C2)-methyltransferase
LLGGVNDSELHAIELARYLEGLSTRINLIPYNMVSDDRYHPPTQQDVSCFLAALRSQGIPVFLRGEKGGGIEAACGQLGSTQYYECIKKTTGIL